MQSDVKCAKESLHKRLYKWVSETSYIKCFKRSSSSSSSIENSSFTILFSTSGEYLI